MNIVSKQKHIIYLVAEPHYRENGKQHLNIFLALFDWIGQSEMMVADLAHSTCSMF